MRSQGSSARRGYCDTFDYLSRPWSYCERTVWATKSSDCQRPFRTGAYLEAFAWKIDSRHSTLAFVSQRCVHHPWWFQYLLTWRRKVSRMEPNLHRRWHGKGRLVSFSFSPCSRDCSTWWHEEGLHCPWDYTHFIKDWSHFYKPTYGWGTRFSVLLQCLREPGEADHSEWSRGSTSFHSQADYSGAIVQTHSKLDVQNIPFSVPFCSSFTTITGSLSWSVWRTCRVQSYSWKD